MFGRSSKNEPAPPVEGTLAQPVEGTLAQKVSCVFCLLYAVFAIVAIPAIFKLLRRDVLRDDNGTITIAIIVCRPKDVEYEFGNGSTVSMDVDEDSEFACKGVGFLAFATVASLIVSATTSVIYAYKDVRSIPRKGTLNLMFILLQSGLITFALLREVVFWENSFREVCKLIFESYYDGETFKVRVHGSKVLIGLACAMSFCACLSLIVRKVASTRRPPAKAPKKLTKLASDTTPVPASTPVAEPQTNEHPWANV